MAEMLERAIRLYEHTHPVAADVDAECQECKELGDAMYHSQSFRSMEREWAGLLKMACIMEDNQENFEQAVRMLIKISIQIGIIIGHEKV